ncbi:MAG: BamA/TamA family outer membrane protein [Draconibacterium sp.]|nr:BamA/TamA family outer membrane protein [Draconibacterium sp.]
MKFLFYILFSLIVGTCFAQENMRIKQIKFKGESALNVSMIKESMTLESTSWFKRKILKEDEVLFSNKLYQEDIRRIKQQYQKNGYLNVSFSEPKITLTKKQKVKLVIFVNETDPVQVSEISYLVDSIYTIKEALHLRETRNVLLQSQLTISKTFSDKALLKDQLLIAEEFSNIGYPFAIVNYNLSVDTTYKTVEVDWMIKRGQLVRFGETYVDGNKKVPDKSILRQLAYKPGDIWSKKKIDNTQRHIYNQGMYRVASIKAKMKNPALDTLPVHIQIKEAPRWTTRFGAGYGREDKFRTFAELQLLGVFTNTGRLSLYGKHSGLEPYNFYLKFSQPSVFFPENTLILNPFVQSEDEPGYRLKKYGFNISMLQSFSKQLNTSFGYEFEDVVLDTINVSGIDSDSEYTEELYYKKGGIVFGGIYDMSEPLLDPVQGYAILLNVKTNGLFFTKALPFYRILTEYKTYVGIHKGLIVALKAKIGIIQRTDGNEYIPTDERFFAGGSNSVRGWSRSNLGPKDESGRPIGGKSLLEGSAELRFSVGKKIILAIYSDMGNVWEEAYSYNLSELRYSVGTGVRVKTLIGPVGIDFARPVFDRDTKWQFHFNIGHSF